MAQQKPQYSTIVSQRLMELHQLWDKLQSTTAEKAQHLFEANRSDLYAQSYADLEMWINETEQQLQADDQAKDLASTNIMIKKLTVCGEAGMNSLCLLPQGALEKGAAHGVSLS